MTSSIWHETHRNLVHAWHCDHYGHVNVRWYAHFFDDAAFMLWTLSGIHRRDMEAFDVHTVVARTETDLRKELVAGQPIVVRSRWSSVGTRSASYDQELLDGETGDIHALQKGVEVFFSPVTRKSVVIPAPLRRRLEGSQTTRSPMPSGGQMSGDEKDG